MGAANRKGPVLIVVVLLIGAAVLLWSRNRGPGDATGPVGSAPGEDQGTRGSGAGAPGESGKQDESAIAPKSAAEAGEEAAPQDALSPGQAPTGKIGGEVALAPSSASQVPHKVVRSWGADGGASRVPGVVGMYVVVSPSISRDDLVKLAQDLLATHRNAKVLNVRILDSAEAATYDKHVDGGQLTREHLVAEVRRNEMQESESIRIRGVEIDPKTGAPLPEKPRTQPPAAPGAN